jgi:hypothetical protein
VHRQVRDSTRLNRISIKPSAVSCVSRTWLPAVGCKQSRTL